MKTHRQITTKNWILIILLGFFGQLAFEVEQHTFTLYVETYIGKTEIITLMVSLSALAVTTATFIFGVLGDRRGRFKWLISIGFIFLGIFTLLFGCANFILKTDSTLTGMYLIIIDVVMSFCGAIAFNAGVNPWTCEISNKCNRGSVSSVLTGTLFISSIILLTLQGTIVESCGFTPIFIFSGFSTIVIGILCIFLLKDSSSIEPNIQYKSYFKQLINSLRLKNLFKHKTLAYVLISICVFQIGREVYSSYLTYYLWCYFPTYIGHPIDVGTASLIEGGSLGLGILFSILFIKILNKGKTYYISVIAVLLSVLGLSIMVTATNYFGMVWALITISFGYVLFKTTMLTWYKNLALHGKKGQLEGSKTIFYMLIPMIVGSSLGQFIIQKIGFTKEVLVNNVSKVVEVPTEMIFTVAGFITIITLIPLFLSKESTIKEGIENPQNTFSNTSGLLIHTLLIRIYRNKK